MQTWIERRLNRKGCVNMKNKTKHSPRKNLIFIPVNRHEMDNESRQILINLYMECSNRKEVDTYVSNSK